jgi:hypothetical protein
MLEILHHHLKFQQVSAIIRMLTIFPKIIERITKYLFFSLLIQVPFLKPHYHMYSY